MIMMLFHFNNNSYDNSYDNSYYNTYYIWLVVLTCFNNLLINGKDDIPYMKWKINDVPNHQPVYIIH